MCDCGSKCSRFRRVRYFAGNCCKSDNVSFSFFSYHHFLFILHRSSSQLDQVIFPSHKFYIYFHIITSCGCLPIFFSRTKSKPFSDEEAKEIINLFKDKKSMRFIGAKFHRGTDSIKEFLILNGLNILPRGIAARKGTPREAAARHVWRPGYRDGCSFEFFLKMSQENCFYCGTPPSNRAKPFANKKNHTKEWQEQSIFIYNGLDRIDSSRDHSEDNFLRNVC